MNGMNEAQINAAMGIIKSTYDANPDVIAAKEQETINEMLYQYGPAYNPAISGAIMQDMGIKDRNLALKIIRQLDENFKKNVAAGYNACKEMYNDGASIDQIKNDLEVSGYSKWEINEIVKRLGMNGGAIRTQNVKEAYSYIISNNLYNGKNIENIKTQLENLGYDAEVADEVVTMLSKLDMSEYQNQDIFDAYTSISDMYKDIGYNGSDAQKKYIRDVLGLVYDEDTIDRAIKLMDSGKAVTDEYEAGQQELTDDQIKADGVNAVKNLFYDAEGNYVYDGSETAKASIRQRLRGSDYEKYTDEIIAQMDADLAELEGAAAEDAVTDIGNLSVEDVSLAGCTEILNTAKDQHGEDSPQYKNIQTSISNKMVEAIEWAFDEGQYDNENLNAAYGLTEYSAEEWAGMTDEDKVDAIVESAGKARKDEVMSEEDYFKVLDEWFNNEIDLNGDMYGYSNVLLTLIDYSEKGYISKYEYGEYLNQVADKISINDVKISGLTYKGTHSYYMTLTTSAGTIEVHAEKMQESEYTTTQTVHEVADGLLWQDERCIYFMDSKGQGWKMNKFTPNVEATKMSSVGSEENKQIYIALLLSSIEQKAKSDYLHSQGKPTVEELEDQITNEYEDRLEEERKKSEGK